MSTVQHDHLPPVVRPAPLTVGAARPTALWVHAVWSAIASGGLMAACYWPLELHWLAWIAMVPWLVVLPRLRSDHAWLGGCLLALVYYRLGLDWMFGVHGLLAGCSLIILSIWMGLSFRVAKMLMDRFGPAVMLWAVPLAFVGQEVLRCEGLPRLRFAFLGWGYSQSHNPWISQIASVGGVYLISFLLAAANTAIAYAIASRTRRACTPAVSVAALVLVLGVASQPRDQQAAPGRTVAVACVQAENASIAEYTSLTHQALSDPSRPRLVVLPEHTIDDCATERHPLVRSLARLAAEYRAYVCVGAHVAPRREGACDYDNVGMLIDPNGAIVGQQAKSVPLPFFLDGNPAHSLRSLYIPPYGVVGVPVCYDALFTDIPRRLVDAGAEVLVVPVMDADRWPVQERWQHADMALFRSIELRRCAVRAASSGVSQIIDAAGRVMARRTKEEGRGVICGQVGFMDGRSVFVRGGWLGGFLIGVVYLLLIVHLTLADWRGRWRARKGKTFPIPVAGKHL